MDLVYPNPTILSTIPKFCPNLKEISFWDELPANIPLLREPIYDVISPPNVIENELQKWPKARNYFYF